MRIKFFTFLMMIILFSSHVRSQAQSGGGGNGGDYIRMKFIEVGNFVLKNYKDGLIHVQNQTNLEALRKTLDIKVINISTTPLIDNGGNTVDALGEVNRIVWYFFKR